LQQLVSDRFQFTHDRDHNSIAPIAAVLPTQNTWTMPAWTPERRTIAAT
jgi:hypothetical protein